MKKITLGLITAGVMLMPVIAMAQSGPPQVGSLEEIIVKLENAAWIVFGGIAVIMFVIAGILFLTAAGNAEKVVQARTAFLWGVAGVVVGIIAFSIIAIVSSVIA